MKKLIAILFSVLMLCALIPFATVAAEEAPSVQLSIVDELEEVNAGEEFQVQVDLLGLEDTAGLIAALVKIDYNTDVFELIPYFDEDEEMWMPPIEVGSKYNASSNKYIEFGQIFEDGTMETCLVKYNRATASATQVRREEHFFTVTFKVKDDAASGTYALNTVTMDGVYHGNVKFEFAPGSTSIKVIGSEPEVPSCNHEYEYDCSKNCKLCGEETRPEAEHEYFYACDAHCMICGELTNEAAAHNMTHVEAVEATCTAPGNIEYWTCDACGGYWDNENATGMPLNRFGVMTFADHEYFYACDAHCMNCGELTNPEAAHNVIHVEAIAPTCTEMGNIEYWYCDICGAAWSDEALTQQTNQMAVKLGATCSTNAIHSEGIEAGCHYTGLVENWYCANCDVYYLDAECTQITNYKSLTIPALQDTAEHVAAKVPTCTENGNVEYWVCYECEQVWADEALTQLTNIMNVQIAPSCKYNAVYTAAKDATCEEPGNVEYWYCENCDVFYLDAECTQITNALNVVLPITHNVIHVEAVEPNCYEPGNIEYWYCDICGAAWLDEYCHLNTNLNAVILPVSHNVIHVEAKDATCSELGNIEYWYCDICGQAWLDELCHLNTNMMAVKLPTLDHTYADDCDAKCNVCDAEREVVLPNAPITFGGNSISEDLNGLAFKFDAAVSDIVIGEKYFADYSNATVIINGEEHKLVKMGAIMNNQGYAEQTLDNVDGQYVLNIEANKVFDASSYAIRIVNIPAEHLETEIIARSYLTYECDGELITIYGEDQSSSYNEALLNG